MPSNLPPTDENDSKEHEKNKLVEDEEDLLCDGQFCQLVSSFEVPREESQLRRSFTDLLISHGAQDLYGRGGIPIGTKDEVLSRERDRCPFCRFVRGAASPRFAPKLLTHLGRKGDDLFVVQVSASQEDEFLWLRVLSKDNPDGEAIGSLMLPGEQIVLVTTAAGGGGGDSRTGRVVGGEPDYERMKNWLRLCDDGPSHRGVCTQYEQNESKVEKRRRTTALPKLRVVDAQDMKLVDISLDDTTTTDDDDDKRYVALSYVWGGANPPKLFKSQVGALSVPGALKELIPSMPATIRDLFTFTRKMGLRFLWFDSLCLIQDDIEDLSRGISNMELVYESSYVTLIAADTESANTGIPGVGDVLARDRRQDIQQLKPGLEVMRVHSVDRHLRRSKWNTRGWTLQEYYLSRRTITFVNDQAYFRCRQRTWYEELWTDLEPERPRGQDLDVLTFARDNMDLGMRDVATYTFLFQILEIYQGRDLTDENDALSAMAGILGRVSTSAKTDIVQGMPSQIFPLSLLFLHTTSAELRGAPTNSRRKRFPSWSWAGWRGGEVSWYPFDRMDLMNAADEDNDFNEDKELENALEKCWITFELGKSGLDGRRQRRHMDETEPIWKPTKTSPQPPVQKHNSDGTINAEKGLDIFLALPEVACSGLDISVSNHDNDHLDDNTNTATAATSATATLSLLEDNDFDDLRIRKYPWLVFHTATVHYRIKTIPEGGDEDDYSDDAERPGFAEYKSHTYEIGGRGDEDCGVLYADEKLLLEDDNVERFVVLEECHEKIEFPLEFDTYCEQVAGEPVFWVMLIRLVDGVWERRGIGQLLQSCLVSSFEPGVTWEKVVLG